MTIRLLQLDVAVANMASDRDAAGRDQLPLGAESYAKNRVATGTEGNTGEQTGTEGNGNFKVNSLLKSTEPKWIPTRQAGPGIHFKPWVIRSPGILPGGKSTSHRKSIV
jgi:hypothetical protein